MKQFLWTVFLTSGLHAATLTVPITPASAFDGAFQGFDPRLGTLLSVSFDFTETIDSLVTNSGASPETYAFDASIAGFDEFGLEIDSPNGNEILFHVMASQSFSGSLAAASSVDLILQATNSATQTTDLGQYLSTGTLRTDAGGVLDTGANLVGGNDIQVHFGPGTGPTGTVTYTFDAATPEPSSSLLLSSGALFMAHLLRRSKRDRAKPGDQQ